MERWGKKGGGRGGARMPARQSGSGGVTRHRRDCGEASYGEERRSGGNQRLHLCLHALGPRLHALGLGVHPGHLRTHAGHLRVQAIDGAAIRRQLGRSFVEGGALGRLRLHVPYFLRAEPSVGSVPWGE